MKTIGLVGGTGWVSTVEYYRLINEETSKVLGGLNAAKCILYSFNYADIYRLNKLKDSRGVFGLVLDAARKLEGASADCIVLCANTLHRYADELEKSIGLPLIHIANATANEIKRKNLNKIGLLRTKFTMEMDFYTKQLSEAGIESLVPGKPEREFIHSAIFDELLKQNFRNETKEKFLEVIGNLKQRGTQGIVLGCTEIPLIIKQEDVDLPVFNTLNIHAKAAVDFALK